MGGSRGSTGTSNLLIIDDDEDIGHLIARVGRGAGLSPTVLTDPLEFKAQFEQLDPDVVTIDILMPGIDGIELVGWVAEHWKDVLIVVISGSDPLYAEIIELIAADQGAEAVHYLPKPLDVEELGRLFTLS